MVETPSASAPQGLGTGRVDQQIKFLASKNLGATHFDFNASALVIGRPAETMTAFTGEEQNKIIASLP